MYYMLDSGRPLSRDFDVFAPILLYIEHWVECMHTAPTSRGNKLLTFVASVEGKLSFPSSVQRGIDRHSSTTKHKTKENKENKTP